MLESLISRHCLVCAATLSRGVLCSACIPVRKQHEELCPRCGAHRINSGDCQLCDLFPLPLRQCGFWGSYSGILQEILQIAKYRPSLSLVRYLCELVTPQIKNIFPVQDWDVIVPVPSSRTAIRTRGFSTPSLLGAEIAAGLKIPIEHHALKHCGYRSPQVALTGKARFRNMRLTFKPQQNLQGRRALLIDDVFTTGATALAATVALLNANASSVDLFTIARATNAAQHRAALHRFIETMVRIPHGKIRSFI